MTTTFDLREAASLGPSRRGPVLPEVSNQPSMPYR
jgi:hypothetical protein